MRAVDHVIARMPELSHAVRSLYLRDDRFRAICEDFALATVALQRFSLRPDAELRPEVDDFRTVTRELEEELRLYLAASEAS